MAAVKVPEPPHAGGCMCRSVRYELGAEARFTIQCYCRDCQHMSGGGNLPQYAVDRSAFSVSGPVTTYVRKSAAGNNVTFAFCGTCGSPIYKATTSAPDLVFVCVGSLDDPSTFEAQHRPYEDSRQPWDHS